MQALQAAWWLAIVWSVCSLAFYRSNESHGPDMVGQEVSAFVLPLLVALGVSIKMVFVGRKLDRTFFFDGPVAVFSTCLILVLEIICYSGFVMR